MTLVPPCSEQEFLDLDGARFRVLRSTATPDHADALPLLLVHGGGTDSAAISWFHTFAEFGREQRVFAVDQPGFGETTGIDPVGSAENLADVMARIAAALGVQRAVVVGVSMGGEAAMQLALRHPGLVEALVLVAPGGLVPVFRNHGVQFAAWLAARLPDRVLTAMSHRAARDIDRTLGAIVRDVSTMPEQVRAEFAREARRPDAGRGYLAYNRATLGPWRMRNDLQPRVTAITAPTLFFHGQDDPIVDPNGSRRAATAMPNAHLVEVPDCGHWAQLEAPARFAAEVRDFLATVS